MPIVWRDAMCVGHEGIDADHVRLIEIINAYEAELAHGVHERALAAILRRLYDYAHTHFAREEQVQIDCGYPFHQAHRKEHQELLQQVQQIIRTHFIERSEPINAKSAADLAEFLRRWLTDHIIKADLRMKPYLEAGRGQGEGAVSWGISEAAGH